MIKSSKIKLLKLEKKMQAIANESAEYQKLQEKLAKVQENLNKQEAKLEKTKIRRQEERKHPYRLKLQKNPAVKWLIVIMIICLFTGFLTPLGDTPYTYLIKTMEGNTTNSISEHQPLTLINDKEFICILVLFLAILILQMQK